MNAVSKTAKPFCAIVHGVATASPSPDELDTLVQVSEISAALTKFGVAAEVVPVGLDLRVLIRLAERRPAIIINLVEALGGSGQLVHLVPAVLESLDLRVTGCSSTALMSASNKPFAKQMMRASGIPTADWYTPGDTPPKDGVWIVKSVWEHASIGLDAGSVVSADRVIATIRDRSTRFGGDWFAERFIDGREFNISLLCQPGNKFDPEILPIGEILFRNFAADAPKIIDYAAKWDADSAAYHNTPRSFDAFDRRDPLCEALAQMSRACWQCFGLSGYARVDFRIDVEGQPWVLEVNANPCLSADAGFMAAAQRVGLTLPQILTRLMAPDSVQPKIQKVR